MSGFDIEMMWIKKSGVRNIAAMLVLKVKSKAVFESELRTVWIFELGQKLTKIATFIICKAEKI